MELDDILESLVKEATLENNINYVGEKAVDAFYVQRPKEHILKRLFSKGLDKDLLDPSIIDMISKEEASNIIKQNKKINALLMGSGLATAGAGGYYLYNHFNKNAFDSFLDECIEKEASRKHRSQLFAGAKVGAEIGAVSGAILSTPMLLALMRKKDPEFFSRIQGLPKKEKIKILGALSALGSGAGALGGTINGSMHGILMDAAERDRKRLKQNYNPVNDGIAIGSSFGSIPLLTNFKRYRLPSGKTFAAPEISPRTLIPIAMGMAAGGLIGNAVNKERSKLGRKTSKTYDEKQAFCSSLLEEFNKVSEDLTSEETEKLAQYVLDGLGRYMELVEEFEK